MDRDHDITDLLRRVVSGDRRAVSRLWERVSPEVRTIARRCVPWRIRRQRWRTTALVDEAYFRLHAPGKAMPRLDGRARFFGAIKRIMRRIGAEDARVARLRVDAIEIEDVPDMRAQAAAAHQCADSIALERALVELEADARNRRKARIVRLRIYSGCGLNEIAEELNISRDTVKRDLRFARAALYRAMTRDDHHGTGSMGTR